MSTHRIVVRDDSERSYLWWFWWLGAALLARPYRVIAAREWSDVYGPLGDAAAAAPPGTTHLDIQVWGHGDDGAPMINGSGPVLAEIAVALRRAPPIPRVSIWWRSCSVHRGSYGAAFAYRVSGYGVESIGHCDLISLPNPMRQRAVCGLRAYHGGDDRPRAYDGGDDRPVPWWPTDGAGLPFVRTLRMRVPDDPRAWGA